MAQPLLAQQWNTSGDHIHNSNNGNVSIGTATPNNKLTVAGTVDISSFLRVGGNSGGAGQPGDIIARRSATTGAYYFGDSTNNYLYFDGTNYQFGSGGLYVRTNGYVGVGITNPSARLHVGGDITVDGNISAKYQDIAEWVPTSHPLSAGSVVVVDPEQLNFVKASSQPYDTKVAGVISAMPGIVLGEAAEGKVKVATTGRVRVRVDATAAPIQVGDLLVSSAKEGVAMRSTPLDLGGVQIHRPGTLIGKALEPLQHGEGEILVLLSLQ